MRAPETRDAVVVGAGPGGLSCAVALRQEKVDVLVLDKGSLTDALRRFPTNMVYFTTPDRLEIGGVPFVCLGEKPTRAEALKYYRRVAEQFQLEVRTYERVVHVSGQDGDFVVETRSGLTGDTARIHARKIVLATGYFDQPNMLRVPGEDLPHVSHYYTEPHAYVGRKVAVIGGSNSAVECALELFRNGVNVTLIVRGAALSPSIKYWVAPDIKNRIEAGEIPTLFSTEVIEVKPDHLRLRNLATGAESELPSDFVMALTGYRPDYEFLRRLGIQIDPTTLVPAHDPETFESNVPGLYLAGVIVAGGDNNKVFIENARFHGEHIAPALRARLHG
jgi:thioredoxin reductase (NADPH)